MKIVVTGGGSGGHITPILAVAHELKALRPDIEIVYVGQTGDGLGDIPASDKNIDASYTVRAGKFRRYHGEGLKQLLDMPTMFKNIRDVAYVCIGLVQSFRLLRQLRPDVIFVKGGFVGVPVGLSAALLRIPYVTHDSDALPGLANRIIARWARLHAVALPKEIYTSYPQEKTLTVGVPLMHHYQPFDVAARKKAREQIGVDVKGRLLLVTGGGLGAQRLNDAMVACMDELLGRYPDLTVIHLAGRAHEAALRQQYKKTLPKSHGRVIVKGFITNLYLYSGAADLIVTRAGATSIAEFAAQHKACIVVPNPVLAGGHQLKNAAVLADRKAVRLVSEDKLKQDERALMPSLVDLLDDPARMAAMGKKLGTLAEPDSAKHLAMVLLDIAAEKSDSGKPAQ